MSAPQPVLTDEEAALCVARALADPQRYRILKMMAHHNPSTPCSAIRDLVDIAPATLSHHMKELRDAGLIQERRTGRTVRYTLRREVIEAFLDALEYDLLPPEV